MFQVSHGLQLNRYTSKYVYGSIRYEIVHQNVRKMIRNELYGVIENIQIASKFLEKVFMLSFLNSDL